MDGWIDGEMDNEEQAAATAPIYTYRVQSTQLQLRVMTSELSSSSF
jgi:hypothetical protein